MRCIRCDSTFHGSAANGYRRVGHTWRTACGPSATYPAERYEEQISALFDQVTLSAADVHQVLHAMRTGEPPAPEPDPNEVAQSRERLERQLATGQITIETFSRAWRPLERSRQVARARPDEVRLRRAGRVLSDCGTL
jgi:hypothetical protein